MNYKFGFIMKEANDFIRKVDLTCMEFITEELKEEFKLKFDENNVVYIEEDVNMSKSEKFMSLLKDNNIDTSYISTVKWKELKIN